MPNPCALRVVRFVRVVLLASMAIGIALLGARPSRASDDDKGAPAPQGSKVAGKVATDKPKSAAARPAKAAKPERAEQATKAAAGGEVTLTGDLLCARCSLHEGTTCQNVLRVKDSTGADVKYYLAKNGVSEENHGKVCGKSVTATVTGKVGSEDGKKVITASAVKFDDR